jgi:NADPH:quinone reductase-like Zn-dependent oxidoreductase
VTSILVTMRAVRLRASDGNLESIAVVNLRGPLPGPRQILVRVAASLLNPSDQIFIRGLYGLRNLYPRYAALKAVVRSLKLEAASTAICFC